MDENYQFLMHYILEEEARGMKITMTRALNGLISQIRLGHVEQNEVDFRRRRKSVFERAIYKQLKKENGGSNEQNNQS